MAKARAKKDTPVENAELTEALEVMQEGKAHDELKRAYLRLQRQHQALKDRNVDLVAAVYEASRDALAPVTVRYRGSTSKTGRKTAEWAVPMLSDVQLGKTTKSYNTEVAAERIEYYGAKILELTSIQREHHPVRHCVAPMLGDMVEGELIFPHQPWRVDSSLFSQLFNCVDIVTGYLNTLLLNFETVYVPAVPGNHGELGGASRRQYNPETNFDRILYRVVADRFRNEPRIKFDVAFEENDYGWFHMLQLGKKRTMLLHGHQVRGGFAGFPWYGVGRGVWAWYMAQDKREDGQRPFHYVAMGHWHQLNCFPINRIRVYVNGSTESDNEFALQQLKAAGEPEQWLLFAHPERGYTSHHPVDLRLPRELPTGI